MATVFCYCCKTHVEVVMREGKPDLKEFNAAGHVNDKDSAKKRYGINTSRLPQDKDLGRARKTHR